jgi:hypothetical protein
MDGRAREAMAIYGLKKMVVDYAHKLYYLIDCGASAEALQIAVENFEANLRPRGHVRQAGEGGPRRPLP